MSGLAPYAGRAKGRRGPSRFRVMDIADTTIGIVVSALACGLLLPLTLAPFDWWPLGIVSIGGWFWLLNRHPHRAALLGFAYGIGKFAAGVSWVYVSMRLYAGASVPLACALVALFVAGLSLFTLSQGWLYARVRALPNRRSVAAGTVGSPGNGPTDSSDATPATGGASKQRLGRADGHPSARRSAVGIAGGAWSSDGTALVNAGLFVATWVLFESLLTWFLTGFPWLFAGYAHLGTPLMHLIPVGGVSLASLGIAATSVFLVVALGGIRIAISENNPLVKTAPEKAHGGAPAATAFRGAAAKRTLGALVRNRLCLFAALGLAALPWVAGLALMPIEWVWRTGTHDVALVQGNVDQALKWRPETRQTIVDRYLEMSEPHWGTDLIIWPEAAITLFEHQAADVLRSLDSRGESVGGTVVLGVPTAERLPDEGWRIYNSALATGVGAGRYSKRRLVPFGDYVPLDTWLRGVIDFFDLPMSSFSPGVERQGLLDIGVGRAAMGICYEIAYGELLRQPAADVLLTISNDTWFGGSIGPLQHMQIARARALENGRWLLRGTNNGVTAIVDHRGRVTAALPQFERGVLTGEFRIMAGNTPYGRHGDGWLAALCLAGLIAGLFHRQHQWGTGRWLTRGTSD